MQSTLGDMPDWMNPKLESRLPGKNNNPRYADDTTPKAESKEEPKSILINMKEESENGLKLNFQKTKIMASGTITSSQKDEEKEKTVTNFIFLCSKITAYDDCSHEINRLLLLGRKAVTKPR